MLFKIEIASALSGRLRCIGSWVGFCGITFSDEKIVYSLSRDLNPGIFGV